MNARTVREARLLAEEFARMAKAVEHDYKEQTDWRAKKGPDESWHDCPSVSPKRTGALRRRSLDLTRALAEMRRP